jgi:phage protein U
MMCVLRNYAWPLRDRHGTAFGCFATRRISAQDAGITRMQTRARAQFTLRVRRMLSPDARSLHCACAHAFTFLADVPHML